MDTVIKIIENTLSSGFDIFLLVLFFLSLKKCFWEEGKSKVGIFFLALIIFPLQWFVLSAFISLVISYAPMIKTVETEVFFYTPSYIFSSIWMTMIIYSFNIILCSFIGILWLRLKKRGAEFVFLYTMFIAFYLSSIRGETKTLFSVPYLGFIINIVCNVLFFILAWFFYRQVILKFSELIKEKTKINWKLFIIPPLAFTLIYSTLAFSMMLDSANEDIVFVSSIFSIIIVFFFVWAFYVILKNMAATNEAIKAKEEIKTLSVEVMEALAHTIDAKDEYTKGHSVRVAKYSKMLAERLGLNDEDCESVYYMALLHDIGKIGVPNEIINSKSKMTDEEYAIMKTHPGIGSDILEEIKSRPDLMIGARWHHERYDGKGYPDQKAGEDIPYFARIISVADSYDAMTSNRSYRKFLPQDVVRGEIEKNCGTQFDPNVAKCMLSIIDEDVNYEYHE